MNDPNYVRTDLPEGYSENPGSLSDPMEKTMQTEPPDGRFQRHQHDGRGSERIHLKNIRGAIRTVTAAPTWVPRTLFDQVALHINGATLRLYVYDFTNNTWHYATLT